MSNSRKKKSPLSLRNFKYLLSGRIPGQLVIQYTDRCNAGCPQCGMRAGEKFNRSVLNSDDVKRSLEHFARTGGQAVSFTGGEPSLYMNDIFELIDFAGKLGIPYIRTGTNGHMFRNPDKPGFEGRIEAFAERIASSSLNTFWISLDSADPVLHETMRKLPGVVKGIEKALPIFHKYGFFPSANLGINRNTGGYYPELYKTNGFFDPLEFYHIFRESFHKFYRFVYDIGFTIINACYPMSVNDENSPGLSAVYSASSIDHVVSFNNKEKSFIFKALFDTIPEFRDKIRIFSPRVSLYSLYQNYTGNKLYTYPCLGGIDFFFISAFDGNTYPCGYRGAHNLGKFWGLDPTRSANTPFCRECDWECFRDPSEMTGPLLELRKKPFQLFKRFFSDKEYFRLWLEDIKYYSACNYFNGKTKPDYARLLNFVYKDRELVN